MGHWHLNSRDVEANKKIFAAIGGVVAKPGDFDIVKFPGVVVFLHLRPGVPPSTGGTDGTVTRIDPTNDHTQTLLGGGPPVFWVAAGAGGVWATRGQALVRIDPESGRVAQTVRLFAQPRGVA